MTGPQWKRITSPPRRFRTELAQPVVPTPQPPQTHTERAYPVMNPAAQSGLTERAHPVLVRPSIEPPTVPQRGTGTVPVTGQPATANFDPAAWFAQHGAGFPKAPASPRANPHVDLRDDPRAKQLLEEQERRILQRIEAKVQARLFARKPNKTIGRFSILEQVGRGGMGTVYSAYDEQLDRKVAIKILRDDELPGETDRLRFNREAQALARLSHPNVVTVHEVGESGGELFLAMEFVRGQSFAEWLCSAPDWRTVLDAFMQVGRGLMAAHEAGLVHRDLKPQNLMRGDDGVVKVLDFGLARVADGAPDKTMEVLTRPGTVVGTPAYMSPEQVQGRPVDASSDQFSFCVALYEALYGDRPFEGYPGVVLSESNGHEVLRAPPRDTKVPAAVRKVLMRGLELQPYDRWPSMAALLEALSRAPRLRMQRWVLGMASVAVLGTVGLAVHATALAQEDSCADTAQHLSGVWDEDRRGSVKEAILGIDRAYSADVWERTERELDEYAKTWTGTHGEVCEAAQEPDGTPDQLLDRQLQCLHRAAVELEAAVGTLADADSDVVFHAHALTTGLQPLSRCADAEAMMTEVEPPASDEAGVVEEARLELARAETLGRAGRHERAQEAVLRAKELTEGLEYGPVQTEVALREGIVLEGLGDYDASESRLEEALELASKWGQLGPMATAARHVMFVVGYRQRRMDEGLSYRPMVEGLARHEPLGEADSLADLAVVLEAGGKYEDAEEQLRTALALRREHLGPEHPQVGLSQIELANVLRTQGHYQEAEAEYREAHSLLRRALGAEHPLVAEAHNDLGRILGDQGRYPEAEFQLRAGLAMLEAALGPDHTNVTMARNNLASILRTQGKHAEAEAELRAVLAKWESTLGPEHTNVAVARHNLGNALAAQGKHAKAETEYRAALSLLEEILGPRDPNTAMARRNLAEVLLERGKRRQAEAEHRAVLSVRTEALNDDHPHVAQSRTDLANVLLELGRAEDALPLAEQAWVRRQNDDVPAEERAQTAFVLARALWSAPRPDRDRTRASSMAKDAMRAFRAAGEAYAAEVREVRRWIADPT